MNFDLKRIKFYDLRDCAALDEKCEAKKKRKTVQRK